MRIILYLLFFLLLINFPGIAVDFPEIASWTPVGAVMTYTSDNLWEYIDGAADQFLLYEFQLLNVREFSYDTIRISVDIYDMGNPLNAFGIFAAQRPQNQEPFSIGSQAFFSPPAQCLLLKDSYYIKIYAYEGTFEKSLAQILLTTIANSLPGGNDLPQELQLLPDENRIPLSEGLIKVNYLGESELNNCIFAKYKNSNDEDYQYFSLIPTKNESLDVIQANIRKKWRIIELNEIEVYVKTIPYHGLCGIIFTKKGSLGVTNAANQEQLVERLQRTQN